MMLQAHPRTSATRAKSSLAIGFALPCLQGNTTGYLSQEPQERTSPGVGVRKM